MTGRRPVGYRAPSWQFSSGTMKQVKVGGLLYDSSLMASDDAYELLLDGQPTGVIELPIERILDDFPTLAAERTAPIRHCRRSTRCSKRSSTSPTTSAGSTC